MKARREEAECSTRHGGDFQDAVGAIIEADAQRQGDIYLEVGDTAGKISRCKVGDHVVTLGPESAAPGANIVCESKAVRSVVLSAALAEIQQARENRDAQVGVFVVFPPLSPPATVEPLKRVHGNDIVVVWNQDDPLHRCFSWVRPCPWHWAIAVRRGHLRPAEAAANFDELDAAVLKISQDAAALNDVVTWANTIQSNGREDAWIASTKSAMI